MRRGGTRKGAGRKSPWSSSETRPIRIPEYLADEVLAFAKKLDRERSLAAKQERLADLLEEFLQLSQENKQEWIEKLPDAYKETIRNANIHRGVFRAQKIKLTAYPDENDNEQPIETEVGCTIKDLGSFRIIELSNGQQIRLESREGKLVCPTMGLPQENVTLFIDDNDGKVYLRICSDWNIDHLVQAEPIPVEQNEGSLDLSTTSSKKLKPAEEAQNSQPAKTVHK